MKVPFGNINLFWKIPPVIFSKKRTDLPKQLRTWGAFDASDKEAG